MGDDAYQYPQSQRDQLPRGESYPLSREELEASLISHGVGPVNSIYFLRAGQRWANGSGRVVEVLFSAKAMYAESLYLRIFSVPSPLRSRIRSALRGRAFDHVAE